MTMKEVLIGVIVPIICGFIGGSIGSIIVVNHKFSNKLVAKKTKFENNGDVVVGGKHQ